MLSGCFTEEYPILPLPDEYVTLSTYRPVNGQVYYSFGSRSQVKSNSVEDWDLAFSCKEDDYSILLNSARGMSSYNTESKDFDATYHYEDYDWEYDDCSGRGTISCLGDWGDFSFDNPQSYGNVYIINMGVDLKGMPTTMIKMKIRKYTDNRYNILISDLDNNQKEEFIIPRNDSFNFVHLSLKTKEVLHLEPPKEDWDILFTSYAAPMGAKEAYPDAIPLPRRYELVEGVLLNPYQRHVTLDSTGNFDNLDFFEIEGHVFNDTTNYIGRNWFNWLKPEKQYVITSDNTYIIKDEDRNYYALEFLKFSKSDINRSLTRFRFKSL